MRADAIVAGGGSLAHPRPEPGAQSGVIRERLAASISEIHVGGLGRCMTSLQAFR